MDFELHDRPWGSSLVRDEKGKGRGRGGEPWGGAARSGGSSAHGCLVLSYCYSA
jgi:hypothetical protein